MPEIVRTMGSLTEIFNDGRTLQNFRAFVEGLIESGREVGPGMEEFLDYMKDRSLQNRKVIKRQRRIIEDKIEDNLARMGARKCPECGKVLRIASVNSCAGCQVGGDWRSMWKCRCGFDELSLLTPKEALAKWKEEVK